MSETVRTREVPTREGMLTVREMTAGDVAYARILADQSRSKYEPRVKSARGRPELEEKVNADLACELRDVTFKALAQAVVGYSGTLPDGRALWMLLRDLPAREFERIEDAVNEISNAGEDELGESSAQSEVAQSQRRLGGLPPASPSATNTRESDTTTSTA